MLKAVKSHQKILSALLLFAIIITILSTAGFTAFAKTNGDIDNNGKASTVDAKWILQNIAGSREFTREQINAADLNGDGKITTVDVKWVLQIVAQMRDPETLELIVNEVKMTDFIGMPFSEVVKLYGQNYNSDYTESSTNQMIVYYSDENIPFSFVLDVADDASSNENQKLSESKVSAVKYSGNYENIDVDVDGSVSSDITYSELKNSKKGILWEDAPMIAYTYKAGDISIDFEYYDLPSDDSVADLICVSKRNWEPTEQDSLYLNDYIIYQSVIDEYRDECNKNHGDNSCRCSWALCDIDGNSPEELIVQEGESEQSRVQHIYTVKDGKAVELGEYNAWHLSLYDDVKGDGKLVGVDGMSMSGNIYSISVNISDNSLTREVVKSFSDVSARPTYQNPIEFTEINVSIF